MALRVFVFTGSLRASRTRARNSGMSKAVGGAFECAVSSPSPSSRDAELHVCQHAISRFLVLFAHTKNSP